MFRFILVCVSDGYGCSLSVRDDSLLLRSQFGRTAVQDGFRPYDFPSEEVIGLEAETVQACKEMSGGDDVPTSVPRR